MAKKRSKNFQPVKHPGAATRKAKAEGLSLSAWEQKHKNDPGQTGKQARLQQTADLCGADIKFAKDSHRTLDGVQPTLLWAIERFLAVISGRHDKEIFGTVVKPVPIDVVDVLLLPKTTAEDRFHHESMLSYSAPVWSIDALVTIVDSVRSAKRIRSPGTPNVAAFARAVAARSFVVVVREWSLANFAYRLKQFRILCDHLSMLSQNDSGLEVPCGE
jgi:hypothetical protein